MKSEFLRKCLPVLLMFALLFGAQSKNLFAQDAVTAPVVAAEEEALQNPDAICDVVEESTAPPRVNINTLALKIMSVVVHPNGGGSCQTPAYTFVFPSLLFERIGVPTWATVEGPLPGGTCTVSPEGWTITCPPISAKVIVYIIILAKPIATGKGAFTIFRNNESKVSNGVEVVHVVYVPVVETAPLKGGG
jgi:hypothetical protein